MSVTPSSLKGRCKYLKAAYCLRSKVVFLLQNQKLRKSLRTVPALKLDKGSLPTLAVAFLES